MIWLTRSGYMGQFSPTKIIRRWVDLIVTWTWITQLIYENLTLVQVDQIWVIFSGLVAAPFSNLTITEPSSSPSSNNVHMMLVHHQLTTNESSFLPIASVVDQGKRSRCHFCSRLVQEEEARNCHILRIF